VFLLVEQRFADEWNRIVLILSAARGEDFVAELDPESAFIAGELPRYKGGTREVIQFRFGDEGPLYALMISGNLLEITADRGRQRHTVFAPDGRELRSYVLPIPGSESLN
jgi:hypothetical protein